MDINEKRHENILIITPSFSNFDATVSTPFKSKMADHIQGNTKKYILNFANVHFVDSSGLGAMIRTMTLFNDNNAQFVLCNVSESVLSTLKLIKLDQLITVLPSEAESISYLQSQTAE